MDGADAEAPEALGAGAGTTVNEHAPPDPGLVIFNVEVLGWALPPDPMLIVARALLHDSAAAPMQANTGSLA